MIDNEVSFGLHGKPYAIIGTVSQDQSSDNRDCDNQIVRRNGVDMDVPALRPESADIFRRLDARGLTQRALAEALGIEDNKVSKMRSGERLFKAAELIKAQNWLGQAENQIEPTIAAAPEYVEVEVLPTFAGMGGGGTGDGDRGMALVPRALIIDVLRGKPTDFLLVNVRGDSMEPDFRHGDQILVDKRDTSPAQPGPFALWDGDWGEYVVKNVERSRSGEVRIFSSNTKYTAESGQAEATSIIGRPVWFGRRL